MKKLMAGLLIAGTCLGMAAPTVGHAVQNPTVEVNGSVGADNTEEEALIEEGSDDWINVDLPTKTIFYTPGTSLTIKSPTYKITNKSGRPLNVKVNSFLTKGTTVEADYAGMTLGLKTTGGAERADEELITGGTLETPAEEIFKLANVNGKMKATATGGEVDLDAKEGEFSFDGTVTALTPKKETAFEMTLELSVPSETDWNQ